MVTLLDLLSLVFDCCWLGDDVVWVIDVDCEEDDDAGVDDASVGVSWVLEDSGHDTITIGDTVTWRSRFENGILWE